MDVRGVDTAEIQSSGCPKKVSFLCVNPLGDLHLALPMRVPRTTFADCLRSEIAVHGVKGERSESCLYYLFDRPTSFY